jgi:tetratricopeptide (TPR) repeat protein
MNIKNSLRASLVVSIAFFATNVFAQDCAKFDAFPGGAEEGKKTHVLYRDLVENEKYDEAFPMWEKLMKSSPAGHVYHFIDGVTMYKAFAERNAEDEGKANEYKQKMVDLFEQRMACMSEERKDKGAVLENMAYSMSEVGYEDIDKTLATYEAVIKENGNKTSAYILAYYADHAIFMYGNDVLDKAKARDVYTTLESIKDANSDNEEYAENWKYVVEYYEPYIDYIFDCDFFKNRLKPEYDANPDDVAVFRPILKKLLQKGCTQDDPFIAAMMAKDKDAGAKERAIKMEEWKTTNPDKVGHQLMSERKTTEAKSYFEKALGMNLDAERLSKVNFSLGRIYHSEKQYGKARGYYKTAASLRSGWGEPYIEIGKMYAASVRSCGNNDGFTMGMVVNAAIDMWGKAKSVDGSVAGEATTLINKYSASVPTKEDGFARGIKQGGSASVGCWIGGSATVRLRSQY